MDSFASLLRLNLPSSRDIEKAFLRLEGNQALTKAHNLFETMFMDSALTIVEGECFFLLIN